MRLAQGRWDKKTNTKNWNFRQSLKSHNFIPPLSLSHFCCPSLPKNQRVSIHTALCTLTAAMVCRASEELERRFDWAEHSGTEGWRACYKSFSTHISSPVPFPVLEKHLSQHNGPLEKTTQQFQSLAHLWPDQTCQENTIKLHVTEGVLRINSHKQELNLKCFHLDYHWFILFLTIHISQTSSMNRR